VSEKIAVVGLGYVGLPVAVAFAKKFPGTIGFDINPKRIEELKKNHDHTGEVSDSDLVAAKLTLTHKVEDMKGATFFVVAVPTPVDSLNRPDLTPVVKASESVGKALSKGGVVVYESTVYPGVTEDICAPVLQKVSGLGRADFRLGYSPERINPGDKLHTLEKITKVVSGEDAATLERVAATYGAIIQAGVHRAPNIKVAEAAKVIENTQRDLNIALMNELALIFERVGIRSRDVLAAAGTKWNFLPFSPGLVGGHCIGVDPYYLTMLAESLGYHPEVILAGRRINDSMGTYIAQRLVKALVHQDIPVRGAKVAILGLTFKEDVPDLRNSRIPDIIKELKTYGITPLVHDPISDAEEAMHEYGVRLAPWKELSGLDAVIVGVAHKHYKQMPVGELLSIVRSGGVVADVKSVLDPATIPANLQYWCL